ncbi:NADPH:quinone reductase [Quadrisphaera granulorum]|uniref:NADPH:quinone reductase-like Zn-dependent oxidoreductase n=1 Tax=Quadrisphaera granulorum TaxID=317664 RepID=A0A316A7P9_9ACTN|nr:NADP-dependent oxidoreductase [Quadrisphaera granulorum]PWJ53633.1 NADPH:quinone reductase-like Zn-dependent oxidoreductase [Quadrisphaera granulorum]SZE96677.1 NADPH:quinone reductase [Quadrisphaera granulorum]
MLATTITTPGGPEALQLTELPLPEPGAGQVRIRVEAAAVNPVDLMLRSGAFHQLGMITGPRVGVGIDLAGVVDTLGPDLTDDAADRLTPGTRVAAVLAFSPAESLAYAEYAVVPAADLAVVPDGLSSVQAASVPLNSLTAEQALDLLGPARGRTLLVTGAAGAVGGYAAQLASERGFVVSGLARPSDEAFVTSTGATLLTELPTTPAFDAVVDAAVLEPAAIAAVVDDGDYVGVIRVRPYRAERGITVHTVGFHPDGPRLAGLLERSARGELPVRVAEVLPLSEAPKAHRLVEAGGLRGRVVLVP